jgi:hypothetical protein
MTDSMKIQDITFSRDIRTALREFPALAPFADSLTEVVIVEDENCERHCVIGETNSSATRNPPPHFYINDKFPDGFVEKLLACRMSVLKARVALR